MNRIKTIKAAVSLFLALLLLTALCTDKKETKGATEKTTPAAGQATANTADKSSSSNTAVPLSDLQKVACDSADSGNTCKTKLVGLDIVSLDDCCKYVDKCCPIN